MMKGSRRISGKIRLFYQLKKIEKTIHEVNQVLKNAMYKDESGTDVGFSDDDNDEVLEFYRNVLNLQENIKRIEESKAKEIYLRKQAELSALQSQINPHFLYNTLETIRGLAMFYGIADIADMTKALADLFRYSINSHGVIVSLEEELKSIHNYFLIQERRFNGKFSLIENVDEDALQCLIPKLLLQPIVENCVHHGLETKSGKGTVIVETCLTEKEILITIKDDGLGIKPKKLEELQKHLKDSNGKIPEQDNKAHIGLFNVNERIQLSYGSEYGLSIESMEGIGTSVEIVLPKQLI